MKANALLKWLVPAALLAVVFIILKTWIAGNNATTNPARIVPLEVQDSARENMQLQQKATKAVTANGVVREL